MPLQTAPWCRSKQLLQRQLANISDTLALAVKRRDSDLRRKVAPAFNTSDLININEVQSASDATIDTMLKASLYLDSASSYASSIKSASIELDSRHVLAELELSSTATSFLVEENDPKKILEDLERNVQARTATPSQIDENDPKQLLMELERSIPTYKKSAYAMNDLDQKLCDEISSTFFVARGKVSPSPSTNLTSPKVQYRPYHDHYRTTESEEDDHGVNEVSKTSSKSSSISKTPLTPVSELNFQQVAHQNALLPKPSEEINRVTPRKIALYLENSGCEWEKVAAWIQYLFGSGANSDKAQKEQDEYIRKTEEDLNKLIEYTLAEEREFQATRDKELLPCRIVVTNIAADAGKEELALIFNKFEM